MIKPSKIINSPIEFFFLAKPFAVFQLNQDGPSSEGDSPNNIII